MFVLRGKVMIRKILNAYIPFVLGDVDGCACRSNMINGVFISATSFSSYQ